MINQVDKYIKKQTSPQKEILQSLRKLILKTFPKINEEIKMGVPWYEGKFYLVALKDHVNLGFAVGGMLDKNADELEGKGRYMRHLKYFSLKDIDEKKIVRLMKATDKNYVNPHPEKNKKK